MRGEKTVIPAHSFNYLAHPCKRLARSYFALISLNDCATVFMMLSALSFGMALSLLKPTATLSPSDNGIRNNSISPGLGMLEDCASPTTFRPRKDRSTDFAAGRVEARNVALT